MEKTKEILSRVIVLFRKYGIKSVTMDDIAGELGISKKTLYHHFSDKDEMLKRIVELDMEQTVSCFESMKKEGTNAIEELFEVNRAILLVIKRYSPPFEYDLKKYYPDVYQNILKSKRKRMYEGILENIKRGKSENLYREDLNEELIALLQVSRMDSFHDEELFKEEFLTGKTFKDLFIYHIRGIANEKGIRFLEENLHRLDFPENDIFQQ